MLNNWSQVKKLNFWVSWKTQQWRWRSTPKAKELTMRIWSNKLQNKKIRMNRVALFRWSINRPSTTWPKWKQLFPKTPLKKEMRYSRNCPCIGQQRICSSLRTVLGMRLYDRRMKYLPTMLYTKRWKPPTTKLMRRDHPNHWTHHHRELNSMEKHLKDPSRKGATKRRPLVQPIRTC